MVSTKGRIKAISVSRQRGTPKVNVPTAELKADFGIVGDAHSGPGARQISLLPFESIRSAAGDDGTVLPGDFAENITTEGLDLKTVKVGSTLRIGGGIELEVTQLGKTCHGRCRIYSRLGDCIMPREGVFARVLTAGHIKVDDSIEIIHDKGGDTDRQR